ncbi:yippee zinc-binding/DNA-binding /Mis18, centromere assembly-domain-containing protein [Hyaloraphidium curvatum]|nr:yippee zinc-binding/DNA-binding /Mis18, centromere assembly-domain-containing protein [Hyaloraphidium curvatum]
MQTYLDDSTRIYTCTACHAHLAKHEDIISKAGSAPPEPACAFQGRHGRAYLFRNVENVSLGTKEERQLITGLHTVADIFCNVCQTTVGWKYLHAYEQSQKYKEGTFIVEVRRGRSPAGPSESPIFAMQKARTTKENGWT